MGYYLSLRNILLGTLPVDSQNVYFQPPESQKLIYPCIVYKLDDVDTKYANDKPYTIKKKYKITVIDRDPESTTSDNVLRLQLTAFARAYSKSNLNYFVYNLYY